MKRSREEQRQIDTGVQPQPDRPNPYLTAVPFAVIVGLHFIGWLFPGRSTWGFSYWSLVDSAVAVSVFAAAALLLVPSVSQAVAAVLGRFAPKNVTTPRVGRALVTILVSAAMLVVLYYFRSRALVYGDGHSVLSDAAEPGSVVLHFQYKFQLAGVYFHKFLLQFLGGLTELTAEEIYALTNAAGGVFGLWAIVRMSGQITTDKTSRAFVLIGALSSASAVLFFGYVENYTWPTALALWTLSFAIGYSERRNGLLGLIFFAALAFIFHMVTSPFVVLALLVIFLRPRPGGHMVGTRPLCIVSAVAIFGSFVFAGVAPWLGIKVLVPLLPTVNNPYSAFSAAHLTDILNELVLVAGLGIVLLVFSWLYRWKQNLDIGPAGAVLGVATLLSFLAAFWIDPEIGAPRDWDLLSFFGFPMTLLGLYRLGRLFPGKQIPLRLLPAVVVVVIVQLGGNLYEKNHPGKAVEYLDQLISQDIHYQSGYMQAQRCVAWAVTLQKGAERRDLAVKYLKRRVQANDRDYQGYFNLGDIYYQLGDLDSAVKYVGKGLGIRPQDTSFLLMISRAEAKRERYQEAAQWASRAADLDPNNVEIVSQLATILRDANRLHESLTQYQRAYRLSPARYSVIMGLGYCHAMTGAIDSAHYYARLALPMAPGDGKTEICSFLVLTAMQLGWYDVAGEYINELRRFNPDSPDVQKLAARLAELTKQ